MIKDSGKRMVMAGMVRDTAEDKTNYDLALDGPMFERWAEHLTAGAKKYAERNWMGAHTPEERKRFRESAIRHFIQWLHGETDEDHAAAVFFNINGVEYVDEKLKDNATELRELLDELNVKRPTYTRTGPADRRKCQHPAKAMQEGWRRMAAAGRRKSDKPYDDQPFCRGVKS